MNILLAVIAFVIIIKAIVDLYPIYPEILITCFIIYLTIKYPMLAIITMLSVITIPVINYLWEEHSNGKKESKNNILQNEGINQRGIVGEEGWRTVVRDILGGN